VELGICESVGLLIELCSDVVSGQPGVLDSGAEVHRAWSVPLHVSLPPTPTVAQLVMFPRFGRNGQEVDATKETSPPTTRRWSQRCKDRNPTTTVHAVLHPLTKHTGRRTTRVVSCGVMPAASLGSVELATGPADGATCCALANVDCQGQSRPDMSDSTVSWSDPADTKTHRRRPIMSTHRLLS